MNKGGAPKGNTNNLKAGSWTWLRLGRPPKGCEWMLRAVGVFKRHLIEEVEAKYGCISTEQGCLIQTACRWEGNAKLLGRYLATEDGISLSDRMSLLKQIGASSDARDKAVKSLRIGNVQPADPHSYWRDVDAQLKSPIAEQVSPQQAKQPKPPASDDAATADPFDFPG